MLFIKNTVLPNVPEQNLEAMRVQRFWFLRIQWLTDSLHMRTFLLHLSCNTDAITEEKRVKFTRGIELGYKCQ